MTIKRLYTKYKFQRFAPAQYHCKKCGRSPLEIEALVYPVTYANTGKTIERAEPVLVCDSHKGCGSVYDPTEYNLTETELCR